MISIKFLNAATHFVFVTCFHLPFLQIFAERSDLVSHWVCRSSYPTHMLFIHTVNKQRGHEFDSSPVPYFRGRFILKYNFYSHLPPSADSRRVVASYERKYVQKVLANRLVKLAQEKVWLGELTVLTRPYLLTET